MSNEKDPADAHDEDRAYWERHAARYDTAAGLLGRPFRRMLELVGQATAGQASVLEVAAGTGLVTPALARSADRVVATDYASAMVARLERRVREAGLGNVVCGQADLHALPFAAAAFDAVVAVHVLHVVPDLEGAIAALTRVLRPDGILIAPTYCHDETTTSWVVSRVLAVTGFPGRRRFTTRSLCSSLERAGVGIRRRETIPGLLPIGYVEASPGSDRGPA